MDKLNDTGKLIALAAIIVISLALVVRYGGGAFSSQNPGFITTIPSGTANNAGATGSTTSSGSKTAQGGTAGSSKSPTGIITFVAPIQGETWTIGQQNTIQWSRAGGVSGEIALLDASTRALVGVILPQTGLQQTSYAWNTRDIALSRTNPLKKDVAPGRYVIRVSWDGNNLSPITSQPITISQ